MKSLSTITLLWRISIRHVWSLRLLSAIMNHKPRCNSPQRDFSCLMWDTNKGGTTACCNEPARETGFPLSLFITASHILVLSRADRGRDALCSPVRLWLHCMRCRLSTSPLFFWQCSPTLCSAAWFTWASYNLLHVSSTQLSERWCQHVAGGLLPNARGWILANVSKKSLLNFCIQELPKGIAKTPEMHHVFKMLRHCFFHGFLTFYNL